MAASPADFAKPVGWIFAIDRLGKPRWGWFCCLLWGLFRSCCGACDSLSQDRCAPNAAVLESNCECQLPLACSKQCCQLGPQSALIVRFTSPPIPKCLVYPGLPKLASQDWSTCPKANALQLMSRLPTHNLCSGDALR